MAVTRAIFAPLTVRLPTWPERGAGRQGRLWLGGRQPAIIRLRAVSDAWRALASVPSWRARSSIGSYRSVSSIFSAGSLLSVGSFLSVGSVGSILSVGSAGSILSIGSSGSILSIGAAGGFAQVGPRREREPDDREDASLRLAAPAPVRSIRPT